jgi:hypothetical protein
MPFTHPPLPTGIDAIRVLTVAPGDFLSPLVGSLMSVAFSDKSKYMALSYTWGRPYPVDTEPPPGLKFVEASVPESAGISPDPTTFDKIIIDAEPFHVGHNLYRTAASSLSDTSYNHLGGRDLHQPGGQ